MAMDDGIRPETWTDGLAGAVSLLAIILVVMLFAPRFAGMWAMGFAAGSVLALIIAPLKGYPMLDIGFAVQAVGGWALMGISPTIYERKQQRAMRGNALALMQMQAMVDAIEAVRGPLVARGQVHPMTTTIPEMVGLGEARVEQDGTLFFTLDSGRSHRIGKEHIKSVEQVSADDEQVPAGTLWIMLSPAFPFAITIEPVESQRQRWLALA
ncbi:hypothetical protein [Streptomyces sp. NBC_00872]|uniref:hypothetical protein n=1 Tax=Streptomyces sp. NBC_00872 TaxID=2903686 RepID=UPI0038686F6A|nr:hypothetical protein OG214_25045 [Streptomyces sp. NBC_00872]